MNNMPKKGRGRPKGATSTVEITLDSLFKELNGDMKAVVSVGRVWLAKRTPASSEPKLGAQEILKADVEPKIEFTIS